MLYDYTKKGRFCADCGSDISVICPTCHGLGYIQPLPDFPNFTVAICDHAGESGIYCSKCGSRIQKEPMAVTCTTCLGNGWVTGTHHYCMRRIGNTKI